MGGEQGGEAAHEGVVCKRAPTSVDYHDILVNFNKDAFLVWQEEVHLLLNCFSHLPEDILRGVKLSLKPKDAFTPLNFLLHFPPQLPNHLGNFKRDRNLLSNPVRNRRGDILRRLDNHFLVPHVKHSPRDSPSYENRALLQVACDKILVKR